MRSERHQSRQMTELGSNVKAVELDGRSYEGDEIDPMLADLPDADRARVVVVFKSGLRTPLPKLDASTGDDAVRVAKGGKVFF